MATKTNGASPDKRRKYDEAFKAAALRLASESRSTQAAARQLGISPKLLYRWQQAQLVAEVGSEEVARDPEVRASRPAQTGRAGARYFKKSLGHLRPADPVSAYRYIAQRQTQVPVRQLCHVLRVAPAAYYAWQRHRQQPRAEPAWQVAVRESFAYHSQRYGTRRLRAEVQAQGHAVGRWRIRRVLHAHGLRAQPPRSFVPRTTTYDPGVRAAPNRLLGQPAPTAPNRVWVGDITYLPRQGGGWLYLAVWLDRCSRKIVGWDVRDTMPEDLVSEALRRALAVRRPPAGLVVHSDQGSQYTATRFKDILARNGAVQSMSRRGNCYDNAHAESFWSRFKAELLDGGSFPGLTEAKLEISHHIAYYNAERRHSALGYHSPNYFETQLKNTSQLCPA